MNVIETKDKLLQARRLCEEVEQDWRQRDIPQPLTVTDQAASLVSGIDDLLEDLDKLPDPDGDGEELRW